MALFLSAFTFVFLAALPGRTTFLMILMAARGHVSSIFAGAALAFGIQTAIAVLLGRLVGMLPEWFISLFAGLLFLYFSVHFWNDSKRKIISPNSIVSWRSAFSLIFAAEWGDVSQVAIASLAARHQEKLTIFMAAIIALLLIAALAIFVGGHVGKKFHHNNIQKLAAAGFCAAGIYLLIQAISAFV